MEIGIKEIVKFGEECAKQTGRFPSYDELPFSYRQATAEHWMKLKLENKWCCVCKYWHHFIEDIGVCKDGKEKTYDDSCNKWTLKELPEWAIPIWNRVEEYCKDKNE